MATDTELFERVRTLMDWDAAKTFTWFVTPNYQLGEVEPVTMILLGRRDHLEKFISEAEEANQLPSGNNER